MEWWEYAAAQVPTTLKLCEWMKDFYKSGDLKRDEWFNRGVDLCLKERKYLDKRNIENIMGFLMDYFKEKIDNPTNSAIKLVIEIVNKLHSVEYDDCNLEDLLGVFFGIRGHEEDKKRLWDKIDKNCLEEGKFRHWAGQHRFDLSKSRLCRCSNCGQEQKCVDIPCPSDIPMKIDRMPFCRDCYSE